jgi:hypothetical protein
MRRSAAIETDRPGDVYCRSLAAASAVALTKSARTTAGSSVLKNLRGATLLIVTPRRRSS